MSSKLKFGLFVAVMLCFSLIIGTTVTSAEQNKSGEVKSFRASPEQLNIIKELWGTNISKGEYLENVFPEALKGLPEDVLKQLYNIPMVWPNPNSQLPEETMVPAGSENEVTPRDTWVVELKSTLNKTTNPTVLNFKSSNTVKYPSASSLVPFMDVTSYLWRKDSLIGGTDAVLVDSAMDAGYNVSSVEAVGIYICDYLGYYKTQGCHNAVFPPGHTPPGYTNVWTESSWQKAQP
ncbi:MAG TPA: hypothetical protein DCZ10_06450 [Pelotomaculum sp.]|nr:hypothetical protein [Pelotomaculum sp.]